ncbi:MAG: sensor domain-containing diguanylate cyclase [Stagnimonas sp.]|nr:sensor domain-containing diguanylate cyclase [Stagnimonas sp.]
MSERSDSGAGEFEFNQHEALLGSNPQLYAQMVRGVSNYGIYLLDRAGIIRSWNLGASAITGFTEDEVLGLPFEVLFTDAARFDGLPERTLQFARGNRHHKDEQPRRRKNGQDLVALCTLDAMREDGGELQVFVEVFTDITEQKQREAGLYQRATRDALTGLINRGHFTEMASMELERARRFSEPLSLALLDIDHFKLVNDSHGHEAGDLALVMFARVCQDYSRKIDYVGRVGGEEIAILLPRANKEPAYEMLQQLRLGLMEQRLTAPGGAMFGITVSVGLATLRSHTRDLRELMRNADAALYKAKREGRNRVEAWFE